MIQLTSVECSIRKVDLLGGDTPWRVRLAARNDKLHGPHTSTHQHTGEEGSVRFYMGWCVGLVCVWESRTPHKLLWRVRLVGHAGPAIHRTGSVRRSWLVVRTVSATTCPPQPNSRRLQGYASMHDSHIHRRSLSNHCTRLHAWSSHHPAATRPTHQAATFHSQVARMPRQRSNPSSSEQYAQRARLSDEPPTVSKPKALRPRASPSTSTSPAIPRRARQ